VKKFVTFIIVGVSFLFSSLSYSQSDDINKTLSNLSTSAAKPYVNPVISAFGSNLNSGWVNKLPSAKLLSFNLDLKIVGMGSFFDKNEKTFTTSGAFRFTSSQADQLVAGLPLSVRADIKNQILSQDFNVSIFGPTIIGSGDERVKVTFPGATFTSNGQPITVAEKHLL